jgi:hypothetical protein
MVPRPVLAPATSLSSKRMLGNFSIHNSSSRRITCQHRHVWLVHALLLLVIQMVVQSAQMGPIY